MHSQEQRVDHLFSKHMDLKKDFNDNQHGHHLDSINKKLTNLILLMRAGLLALVVIIITLFFFMIRLGIG